VDVVCNRELLAADANEQRILDLIGGKKAKIIVTVIGGQGYLFGRGNQQISAAIIEKVGKKNIIVVAVKNKIMTLEQGHLLVDTGNDQVNAMLQGYIKIITNYREELVYRLSS
jgi:predicted polyphosphate/ATP-dependent NAD kinase